METTLQQHFYNYLRNKNQQMVNDYYFEEHVFTIKYAMRHHDYADDNQIEEIVREVLEQRKVPFDYVLFQAILYDLEKEQDNG